MFFDTTFRPASQGNVFGKRIRTSPESLDFTWVSRLALIIRYWHLFARAFYALDKDLAKLADLLGHASIETTRIYIMESGAEHKRQVERLGLIL